MAEFLHTPSGTVWLGCITSVFFHFDYNWMIWQGVYRNFSRSTSQLYFLSDACCVLRYFFLLLNFLCHGDNVPNYTREWCCCQSEWIYFCHKDFVAITAHTVKCKKKRTFTTEGGYGRSHQFSAWILRRFFIREFQLKFQVFRADLMRITFIASARCVTNRPEEISREKREKVFFLHWKKEIAARHETRYDKNEGEKKLTRWSITLK